MWIFRMLTVHVCFRSCWAPMEQTWQDCVYCLMWPLSQRETGTMMVNNLCHITCLLCIGVFEFYFFINDRKLVTFSKIFIFTVTHKSMVLQLQETRKKTKTHHYVKRLNIRQIEKLLYVTKGLVYKHVH